MEEGYERRLHCSVSVVGLLLIPEENKSPRGREEGKDWNQLLYFVCFSFFFFSKVSCYGLLPHNSLPKRQMKAVCGKSLSAFLARGPWRMNQLRLARSQSRRGRLRGVWSRGKHNLRYFVSWHYSCLEGWAKGWRVKEEGKSGWRKHKEEKRRPIRMSA